MSKQLDFDKKLDETLSKPPGFELPIDFSDKVIRRIEMKRFAYDRRIHFVVILFSFGFLVLAAICFLVFTSSEALHQMLDFGSWGLLIGVMVVLIQILDHRLIKKKMFGTH